MNLKTKKPTHAELAKYLGVSTQAVRQYPEKKRKLMILGLWMQNEILANRQIKGDTSDK